MIALVRLVARLTGLSKAASGVLSALLVLALVAGAFGIIYWEGRQDGEDAVRERDQDAVDRAVEGIRSARACRDAGGVWSQTLGECRKPLLRAPAR